MAGVRGQRWGPFRLGLVQVSGRWDSWEPSQLRGGRCGRESLHPPALGLSAVEPPVNNQLLCVAASPFLFTCPDVLEGNLCRAKDAFYPVSVECQSGLGNLSTPVIWIVIPIIKAKPDHLAAIAVMSCSMTVGHCAAPWALSSSFCVVKDNCSTFG